MNNVNRALVELREEGPQLRVVAAPNGASKRINLSAPLVLPSRFPVRRNRPELAVLAWSHRANRLARRK